MGVGSLTDHGEAPEGSREAFVTPQPHEAAILRIQPHTRAIEVYANGIRNPYDLAFGANGSLYATDNGLLTGEGDRLLHVERGAHYGFPHWRARGCEECVFTPGTLTVAGDLWTFPPFTLPRGVTVYTGNQFPVNIFHSVFVTLWNGVEGAQRVIRVDPRNIPAGVNLPDVGSTVPPWATITPEPPPEPEAFVTGLIRPIDVVIAPDGALVVADFVYGNVWRVRYIG
jgi:glucose/arabinose dehydrogenase